METRYDQLVKLKQLLDDGTLTQEEFEAAKKRILNEPYVTHKSTEQHFESTAEDLTLATPKFERRKWFIWGSIGIVLVITIIILMLCFDGKEEVLQSPEELDWTAATAEADSIFDAAVASAATEDSDEYFDTFNPWHLDHFRNEWGEETSSAYLYTIVSGKGWNLRIDYIPENQLAPSGVFRFSITDDEGYIQSIEGPAYIIVRGSSGENLGVPVVGVQGSMAFVEDEDTVDAFKVFLDQENFDILMEFDKYNERHRVQARWESTPGFFQRAIDCML